MNISYYQILLNVYQNYTGIQAKYFSMHTIFNMLKYVNSEIKLLNDYIWHGY